VLGTDCTRGLVLHPTLPGRQHLNCKYIRQAEPGYSSNIGMGILAEASTIQRILLLSPRRRQVQHAEHQHDCTSLYICLQNTIRLVSDKLSDKTKAYFHTVITNNFACS
jgi:hypothetical protein